jgi:hypothetical protein
MKCGYCALTCTLINRNRSAADSEGWRLFKLRKDGSRIQRPFECKGHGTCCLRSPTGAASAFSLHKPLPPAQQQEITAAIQAGRWGEREIDPNGSCLTVWDDRARRVRRVVGVLPRAGRGSIGQGAGCGS